MTRKLRRTTLFIAIISIALCDTSCVAQWVQTNGPYTASVESFATIDSNVFITSNGGVFESSNNGLTWKAVNTSFSFRNIAVIDTDLFGSGYGTGIFHSSDYGITWHPADSGLPPYSFDNIATYGNRLFLSSSQGVFESSDRGNTWQTNIYFTSASRIFATNSYILVVGTEFGSASPNIYRSSDTGKSWTRIGDSLLSSRLQIFELTGFAGIGSNLFVATDQGIFRSTDIGETWDRSNRGLNDSSIDNLFASHSILYALTYNALRQSSDTGKTWNVCATEITPNTIQQLYSKDNYLFAGTGEGIYISMDSGLTWSFSSQGLFGNSIVALCSFAGRILTGTSGGGIFRSSNNGDIWKGDGLSDLYAKAFASDDSNFYAGGAGFYISRDTAKTWIPMNKGLSNKTINTILVKDTNLFVGTWSSSSQWGGIFRSSKDSVAWRILNFLNLDFGPAAVQCLYARGNSVLCTPQLNDIERGVFESSDNGNSWVPLNSGLPPSVLVQVFAYSKPYLFIGTSGNGIFKLRDGDTAWTPAGLSPQYITSLTTHDSELFAGTYDSGIFVSINDGQNWRIVDEGLLDSGIRSLAIGNGYLFVGTVSQGVWRRPLAEMIGSSAVEKPAVSIPQTLQAYPNPSSQATTIRFSTSERSDVKITIVNLLGEPVAQLFAGELDAGEHSFSWNAQNAPAGNYFAIARMNDHVERCAIMVVH